MDAKQLNAALGTTKRMMVILLLATVAAVSLAFYIFNKLIARQIALVGRALKMFGGGQLETRISRERRDEFGDLFNTYNDMAEELEKSIEMHGAQGEERAAGASKFTAPTPDVNEISGITMQSLDDKTIMKPADSGSSQT